MTAATRYENETSGDNDGARHSVEGLRALGEEAAGNGVVTCRDPCITGIGAVEGAPAPWAG